MDFSRRPKPLLAASLFAAVILVVGLEYATTVAGGADAYGYVSQADLWRHGDLIVRQPWMADVPWPSKSRSFSPLGYRPYDDEWAIVPTYSPGLPMIMAATWFVFGARAVFWVVPVAGAVLVLATYGIGRALASSRVGGIAAWLVATSPVMLFMLMAPMTDVPVAAAWSVAFYFLFARSTIAGAAASGLATAIAILIRPNLVPAAAILSAWFVIQAWRDAQARRQWLLRFTVFGATAAIGIVTVAIINHQLYGSALQSGYPDLSGLYRWTNIRPNTARYFSWLAWSQTPLAVLALAALVLPIRAVWRAPIDLAKVAIAALFVISVWAQYLVYQAFDAWWYLRFLLPTWPFIMIALAAGADRLWSRGRIAAAIAIVVIAGLGVYGVLYARSHYAFEEWRGEARYVTVARAVRSVTDRNSVIFAVQHSGTLRYYAGRMTLRFDWIGERWLDRSLTWLKERGIHPYAVLDEWEVEQFRVKFGELSEVGKLKMKPLIVYNGTATVFFYDLANVPVAQSDPQIINETWTNVRYPPQAPRPTLVFSK